MHMFGVLVDVSGSMQNAYDLDRKRDASVERVHAIITTIVNIVKQEVSHHDSYRQASIFVNAFGLSGTTDTCDLIALLDCIARIRDLRRRDVGYSELIDMAEQNGATCAREWIRDHLSDKQAGDLYRALCFDESLITEMIKLLPDPSSGRVVAAKVGVTFLNELLPSLQVGKDVERLAVQHSKAYMFAEKLFKDNDFIINRALKRMQHPQPKSVQSVSELLDRLNLSKDSSRASFGSSSESLHDRIEELIDPIRPYIFGGTPMCKAMNDALTVFKQAGEESKVLFILSDGQSADGDPCPIARELHKLGVTIVTCYLTADHIDNPRCLLDKAHPGWPKDGRSVLFEMSSTRMNVETPLSYLIDAKWELPSSGESRLFVQANSLDVVDEVCETVVSQLANPCDALVDILEKVPLADYINQRNDEFEPKTQDGGTCYANAVATVFHLAMHRIVGREGGYPDFYTIRDRLIKEYGKKGANTRKVLKNVCPEYRLHFSEVDEAHARQALNKRRPVVARFSLFKEQWSKFSAFYCRSPKKILQKSDVTDELFKMIIANTGDL